ncbi:MAG TPA: hypothetical protein DDW94_03520 [Deltaproteobacteria bacterium]|nr:MAG: hypothetical protein A2Z79_10215 [Deltaproteobacteria bacterium GWA2_55_82]OGQ62990.1 MAG: hypothetical protein A3I81_06755 [Deltaproteobacteria bacterium RIFCSPLOWO2_02_FULL_55_12]OIJ72954.1 MAG: hypothetical protein A2V21_300990 [Deltaproteobacteria bacterium GWC2_55_46]HBG46038.1 hypothetical protein [Deltaproteobacteria bacterium]HCY11744.1 hypothetical protein [Deltaproteobacteria bacterium]
MEVLNDMEEPKKTIFDQLSVFIYRKWLFLAPLAAGTVVGLMLSFEIPEKYSSSTLIVVEEQQIPEEYVTPTDRTPFSQRLNVISQQILSRTKLDQIIKEYKLYEDQGPSRLDRALAYITGNDIDYSTPEDTIEQMRQDIQFTVIGEAGGKKGQGSGGNAFSITYLGSDPQTTMEVTNTLASLFIEENLRVREQYAEGTSEFITSELDSAQEALEKQEQSIKEFKQAHMGALPEQLEANLRTLDRLQLELQNVTTNLKLNEDRRNVLEEQLSYGPIPASSSSMRGGLATELESAKGELAMLLSMFKETYPDVIILKKRIKDLEARLDENAGGSDKERRKNSLDVMNPAYAELMSVKSQISTLRQRDNEILRNMADYQRKVELTPNVEQQQSDLMRDYQISLDNYQGLLGKKMNARLAENLEKRQKGARFRVVDPANLPDSPDYPNKPLVSALGLLGGGAFGTGLVFLFEFLNPAFRKPEDFEGTIDIPVLSSIPLFLPDAGKTKPELKVVKGRTASA